MKFAGGYAAGSFARLRMTVGTSFSGRTKEGYGKAFCF
jgi:hypothetical protein